MQNNCLWRNRRRRAGILAGLRCEKTNVILRYATRAGSPNAHKDVTMLKLSRKPEQSIHIDGDIVITVIRISSGSVMLGITAPKKIGIFREELHERISANSCARCSGNKALVEFFKRWFSLA
jgi:carbon storage regulator